LQLNPLASARYDSIKFNHVLDFFIAEETPIIPNSEYHLQQFFLPTGVLNMSQYSSPACNAVIKQLIAISTKPGTKAKQIDLITQAQKILVRDLPQIPLAFTAAEAALSRNVHLDKYLDTPGGVMSGAQMIMS
jgi:ABC-type transport system substrate-binding protein